MRKKRATSNAENLTGAGRSLRSGRADEFYEIPTKFRNKIIRPEVKECEKFSPTRRSSRLSGEDFELQELSCRARKRRLSSYPNGESIKNILHKNKKNSEDGLKPSKLLRSGDQKPSSQPSKENGLCSRSRQRIDELDIKYKESNSSKSSTRSPSLPPSPLQVETNSTPKRTRSSPRASKSSLGQHNINCTISEASQQQTIELAHKRTNGQQNVVDSTLVKAGNSEPVSEIESCDDCKCFKVSKSNCKIDNTKCEFCGKFQLCKTRKNGSIGNGSLDSIPALSRNLRSSGQAMSVSSRSSIKCAGSPMAGEEATSREFLKEFHASEDDSISNNLRRNRRKSELELKQFFTASTDKLQNAATKSDLTNKDVDSHQRSPPVREKPADSMNVNMQHDDTVENGVHNSLLNIRDSMERDNIEPGDRDSCCSHPESAQVKQMTMFDEFSCAELDLLSDSDDFDSYQLSKRKMNLRSSGVRCDPDFYTLSLDLMIKRPRTRMNWFNGSFSEANDDFGQNKNSENTESSVSGLGMAESTTAEVEMKGELANSVDDTRPLFTAKSNLNTDKETDTLCTEKADAIQHPSPTSTTSTPQRPQVLHRIQYRGRGRPPKGLSNSKLARSPSIRMVANDPSEPPPLFNEEPPAGPDVYYFESDHVALKHNKDYHNLLCTVSVLESQRHHCIAHIKSLEAKKSDAMREPVAFVENLQKGVQLDLPCQQNVPALPDIEWSKYTSVYGTFDHVFASEIMTSPKKPATRKVQINFETGVPLQSTKDNLKGKDAAQINRSQSFRVSWTVEEQRKLEELLLKYPSEEIEFNRYRKIAAEFENRTPLQVQSRVQKYFIKLAKAGLPVPGHMPRLERLCTSSSGRNKRARSHPHQQLTKMSTFFPTFHVPVKMADDDLGNAVSNEDEDGWTIDQEQISDEEDVPEEMRFSDEYLEILRLKRIRRERLRVFDNNGQQALAQHVGFECDMCNCDPIQGVRYHCIDCPTEDCVDLCQSCIRLQGQFETEHHKASHRMQPVYKAESFMDDDYLRFASHSGEYNYLDPNFLPPNT